MRNLKTFGEFINESSLSIIDDKGTIKTKFGNLKYEILGGLDRGGNRGKYPVTEESLSSLINSIDFRIISKILNEYGIELDDRPSEFELSLANSGLGYNGLSVTSPEIRIPVTLSKDYPKRERGHISKSEYEIYGKLNDLFEKALGREKYTIHFVTEYNRYGSSISDINPKITITFQQGSLS
jgi:hypothetical protein